MSFQLKPTGCHHVLSSIHNYVYQAFFSREYCYCFLLWVPGLLENSDWWLPAWSVYLWPKSRWCEWVMFVAILFSIVIQPHLTSMNRLFNMMESSILQYIWEAIYLEHRIIAITNITRASNCRDKNLHFIYVLYLSLIYIYVSSICSAGKKKALHTLILYFWCI